MKFFKIFLLVLAIILSSLRPRPSETSESRIINDNKTFGNQALLDYVGTVSAPKGMGGHIGIQVSINTTIGVRYELTSNIGGAKSHMAMFYKFSKPYQTVFYNFVTHKSTVMKGSGSIDPDPDVEIVGKEKMNTYSCTHLRHRGGTEEISDYWMSEKIPGFSEIVLALMAINQYLPGQAFSGTIFQWGGLVKMTDNFESQGQSVNFELHLQKANTNVTLPSSTFDVPSK
jgi:hypothetical protein